jgi:hypothetical protein
MALRPDQLATLLQEIGTDPNGYGLVALRDAGNAQGIADALNLVRTGANGGPAITVRRSDITPEELLDAIDVRDFPASPAGVNNQTLTGSWLESVLQFQRIPLQNADGTNNRIRTNLNRLLGDTNGSQARLTQLSRRQGSRAEQLFGAGTRVAHGDVSDALALG